MAFDTFIKIDGIEGESTDSRHEGWIELIRYGLGLKQATSNTASSVGGAGSERVDFAAFRFRKLLDKASPKLALACAAGTHINSIVVELCRAGTTKINFMTYTLMNCLVSRVVTTSGSDTISQFPAETVDINFGKIEWRYGQQMRQDGGLAGNFATGWSLENNKGM